MRETLCEGQYGSILPFLTAVDVFGSTCTYFWNLENSEKNMVSSSKTYTVEEVIDKIFESDEGERLSEIDSEVDPEDKEACNRASLMFVDDGISVPTTNNPTTSVTDNDKVCCGFVSLCIAKFYKDIVNSLTVQLVYNDAGNNTFMLVLGFSMPGKR